MAKMAIYFDDAQRLYVQEGLSLDAIVGILTGKVSRKTLYNWKVSGDWDTKRRNYLKENQTMYDDLQDLARQTIREAKADPSPHKVFAMAKAISALKMYQAVDILEKETTPVERAGLTEATIRKIEEEVLGL
jgi:hypothetical protein